jgi:hypothetical protein
MVTRTLGSVVAFVLLFAAAAFAQAGLGSASLRGPVIVQPFPATNADVFAAPPGTYVPNPARPGEVFGAVGGWWPWAAPSDTSHRHAVERGFVQVEVQPSTAQIYVDGLYIGTAADLRARRSLEPGSHRVELRAAGYESTTVDLRIDPGETTVYRGALTRTAPTPAAPVAVAQPKAFYVIPGCYAGDKRPQPDRLPGGCDVSRLRVVPPTVSRAL